MSSRRRAALALCCCLSSASAFSPASTTAAVAPSSSIVASRRRPRSGSASTSVAETQLHVSASHLFGGTATATADGQPYLPQVNHRHSARDWIHNVASLPHSSILRDIRGPVLAVLAWSTVVSVVHRLLMISTNPVWAGWGAHLQVGPTAHSFLVSSLGLLLVFRTNSAYQRFAVSTTCSWKEIRWIHSTDSSNPTTFSFGDDSLDSLDSHITFFDTYAPLYIHFAGGTTNMGEDIV